VGFYSEDIDANCVLEKILVGVLVPEMGPWEQCEKYLLCIYIYICIILYIYSTYVRAVCFCRVSRISHCPVMSGMARNC
jgi:hypothetical protein